MTKSPLLTRKQLAETAKRRLGIPLTVSRIEKLAMVGKGPPVAAKYGNTHLHEEEAGLEWARNLLTPLAEAS